jgi:hypothetical protein
VPALKRCGSSASAVKLANISPNANIISADRIMNTGSGSRWVRAATNIESATTKQSTSAPCEIMRMPSRPTRRALRKPAIAIDAAMAAKASGK